MIDKITKRILCIMLALVIIATMYFIYAIGILVGKQRAVDEINRPRIEAYKQYIESQGGELLCSLEKERHFLDKDHQIQDQAHRRQHKERHAIIVPKHL